ncbi:quinone oxidoreductase [Plectosphaerella cucumerina]|uniref:Probable quinone oxidoreductase n=1 Tax=Plectosphaerella cucumerina TaxID=40658 RepID=A0A8K0X0T9_9PEZI|nr:quinone oxidoreductase [Plectosphaerella cucumerina]
MASSNLPSAIPAVQISKTGGPEVLTYTENAPLPKLAENQVLVRNAFAGVNFIDTYFRTGLYATPPENFPLTLGREASGTVAAVHPSVTSLAVGDKVVYMGGVGTYAAYSAVPAALVLRVPDGLALDTAAASLLQGLTAWTFVREAGVVQPGEWVLVHAAAGGVGGLLVQMLSALGAKVIATAGSDEKCALAREKGAGWTVNSRGDGILDQVKEITGGHGVDVIFDGVGKATFDLDIQLAARKGRLVVFGNASGAVPPFDILRLGPKNLKIMRPVVNNYVAERHELEKYSSELFEMLVTGKVKIDVHKTYPLKDAAQAHVDLEGRKTTGKLIIKTE